jgi:hypothetical protein
VGFIQVEVNLFLGKGVLIGFQPAQQFLQEILFRNFKGSQEAC